MSKMNEDFKNIQVKIINDVEGDTNKQINPVQDQEKNISKIQEKGIKMGEKISIINKKQPPQKKKSKQDVEN